MKSFDLIIRNGIEIVNRIATAVKRLSRLENKAIVPLLFATKYSWDLSEISLNSSN